MYTYVYMFTTISIYVCMYVLVTYGKSKGGAVGGGCSGWG